LKTHICNQVQLGRWTGWWADFSRQSGKGENRFPFRARTRAKELFSGSL
jgi:hypothetical protein